MSRIMIAGNSHTIEVLEQLLSPRYDLILVTSMREAIPKIHSDQPELVICGMLFEESRMFDFLRAVKADPAIAQTKFICSRVVSSDLPNAVMDALTVASLALGAVMFLDVFELLRNDQRAHVFEQIEVCLRNGHAE